MTAFKSPSPPLMENDAIQEATDAMVKLNEICMCFDEDKSPSWYAVMSLLNKLVNSRRKVGIEYSQKFGGGQRKKLQRKRIEAKAHRSFRDAGKKLAECASEAFEAASNEYDEEINALEEYENYAEFLRSMDNAIRYGISVQSSISGQEKNARYEG